METVRRDVAYALRSLRRTPGFALAAIATLALGIGANTAVFSGIRALLLRPLPLPEPDRLVYIWSTNERGGQMQINVSVDDAVDWREATGLASLGLYSDDSIAVGGGSDADPVLLTGLRASADLLGTLGLEPILGRGFVPEEDRPGGAPAVMLGHGYWQQRFGGDPDVLGRTLLVDGLPRPVVGVLPPQFVFPYEGIDVYVPLAVQPGSEPRGSRRLRAVARLAPGASLTSAEAELSTTARRLAELYPDSNAGYGVRVQPIAEDVYPKPLREALYAAMAAVAFVLLVGCANVANLLLVRASGRRREVAVRLALGASRRRVLGQLLTESLVLSLLGGALGVLLAAWGVGIVSAEIGAAVPRVNQIGLDAAAFAFALGVSVSTALVFGLAPALQATRTSLRGSLRDGARAGATSRSGARVRQGLVVAEVALTLVLLAGGGVMLRRVLELTAVEPGFDASGVTAVSLSLPESRYPEPVDAAVFFERLLDRLESAPGSGAVGIVNTLPMDGSNSWRRVEFAGQPLTGPAEIPVVGNLEFSPGYLQALRIPLRRGRLLTANEAVRGAPLVLVNEALADRYWPEEEALGQRLRRARPDAEWMTVVGVVGNVRHRGHASEVRPELYLPFGSDPMRSAQLVVRPRGGGDPIALARAAVAAEDPLLPVGGVRSMEALLAGDVARERSLARLLGGLAAAAFGLALLGIYGVVTYAVRQAIPELGVRIALGASASRIGAGVLRQTLGMAGAGVALGALLAMWLSRVAERLVLGASPADPLVLSVVSALLLAGAGVAGLQPARRAARVEPASALRSE